MHGGLFQAIIMDSLLKPQFVFIVVLVFINVIYRNSCILALIYKGINDSEV